MNELRPLREVSTAVEDPRNAVRFDNDSGVAYREGQAIKDKLEQADVRRRSDKADY